MTDQRRQVAWSRVRLVCRADPARCGGSVAGRAITLKQDCLRLGVSSRVLPSLIYL
jgi:hypothetical protein